MRSVTYEVLRSSVPRRVVSDSSLPHIPYTRQINTIIPSYLFKIRFNIVPPLRSRSCDQSKKSPLVLFGPSEYRNHAVP